jgi:pimeloyl-ACP methyl ester carboxylesterase
MKRMPITQHLVILVLTASLAGCVPSMLARQLAAPPNKSGLKALFADSPIVQHGPVAYRESWTVEVANPPAKIAVSSIEPGDYGFVYDLAMDYPEGKVPHIVSFNAWWRNAAEATAERTPSRGTVILLHGYLQSRAFLAPWAVALAEQGFRCVVVDLRGHGESTGLHVGFGAFEARDISLVIDDLDRRGWDVSRVGLFGISYGASVAMLTAGGDPRISTIVALQPFASADRAIPELMRAAFPQRARGISDTQFAAAHAKLATLAGYDWPAADVPAALARTRAPILFVHGEADTWLSPAHSRELVAIAPPGSELSIVPRENHVTLPLQLTPLLPRVREWFDEKLAPGPVRLIR